MISSFSFSPHSASIRLQLVASQVIGRYNERPIADFVWHIDHFQKTPGQSWAEADSRFLPAAKVIALGGKDLADFLFRHAVIMNVGLLRFRINMEP